MSRNHILYPLSAALAATLALAAVPMVCQAPDSTPVAIPEFSFLAPTVSAACRLPFSCGPPA